MRALQHINLNSVLFFDIETVAIEKELTEESRYYDAWYYKMRNSKEFQDKNFGEEVLKVFGDKAALYAEFGKIVTISIGYCTDEGIAVKSFYSDDETVILEEFFKALDKFKAKHTDARLCGHSIKDFDIPYVMRRALINRIKPHPMMDTSDLKPWELNWILDTKELFRGTGFTTSSLIALTTAFGLPNPKQDIGGHETTETYYNGDLLRVAKYCEKDVVAVANVLRCMMFLEPLEKTPNELDFIDVPLLEKIAKLEDYDAADATQIIEAYQGLPKSDKPKAKELIETIFKKPLEEIL